MSRLRRSPSVGVRSRSSPSAAARSRGVGGAGAGGRSRARRTGRGAWSARWRRCRSDRAGPEGREKRGGGRGRGRSEGQAARWRPGAGCSPRTQQAAVSEPCAARPTRPLAGKSKPAGRVREDSEKALVGRRSRGQVEACRPERARSHVPKGGGRPLRQARGDHVTQQPQQLQAAGRRRVRRLRRSACRHGSLSRRSVRLGTQQRRARGLEGLQLLKRRARVVHGQPLHASEPEQLQELDADGLGEAGKHWQHCTHQPAARERVTVVRRLAEQRAQAGPRQLAGRKLLE